MTAPSGRKRVQGIDLLRGIAIALVMLRHAFPSPFAGAGVVGVVMFFTLSGYLITGVLLAELRVSGGVDLRRFYARRVRRLVPALLLMTSSFALVTLVLDPLGDRRELVRSVVVALTYTADLPFHHGSAATFHLWTLAMEEQFYLVWPALLAISWARRRVGTALLVSGLLCLAACCATLVWVGAQPDRAYPLPTSWAVCFVIGGAARWYVDRGGRRPAGSPRGVVLASSAALTPLAALSVVALRGHAFTYLVAAPAVAALTAVLLVTWREWYVVRPRLLRALIGLGTISYGAYLWNYPLTLWLRPTPETTSAPSALLAAALTIVVAWLSWRLVEEPLQRRRATSVAEPVASGSRS